ncbi:MAG TPA: tetratricopeptide repeat protein [Pyrinomonadaceae bacterium]
MRLRLYLAGLLMAMLALVIVAQPKMRPRVQPRTLTIATEPGAIVWLDEIRRGVTDPGGRLPLTVSPGAHTLRVRANGFKELTMPIAASARGEIKVRLLRATDNAELLFQKAETARESAKSDQDRQNAADLYRQALRIRPAYPAAHVGLARMLMDLNDTDGALAEIEAARRYRPAYPEASAVEGRVYRETGQTDDAIGSFNRAIRESHGFQPEAHVGLGRTYEEKGQYDLAAREFQIAINQLADTEPIIYQLLGAAYEKSGNPKEAIVAYENYLRLAPNGSQATAVRSIIEQLKSEQP